MPSPLLFLPLTCIHILKLLPMDIHSFTSRAYKRPHWDQKMNSNLIRVYCLWLLLYSMVEREIWTNQFRDFVRSGIKIIEKLFGFWLFSEIWGKRAGKVGIFVSLDHRWRWWWWSWRILTRKNETLFSHSYL